MKKFIALFSMLVVLLMLSACSKDVAGKYAAIDKEIGQVDLNIEEKDVTMEFTTMVKAADKASQGLFASKIDTSKFKLNGTIDKDKKRMNLKTGSGESFDATYEVDGDSLKVNVKNFKEGIKFYKKDSDEFVKQSSKFNEEEVINNMSF